MNRGRPLEALSLVEEAWADEASRQSERIQAAMFWDGDSATAERAAQALGVAAQTQPAASVESRFNQLRSGCFVGLWRIHRKDTAGVRSTIHLLRAATNSIGIASAEAAHGCAELLEAQLWSHGHSLPARAEHLDALMRQGPGVSIRGTMVFGNLLAARLLEEADQLAAARAASRRRWYWGRVMFLSTFLRDEARLSEKIGDRAGAIRAYRHYLALRSDPEPALRGEVDRVRAKLDGLTDTTRIAIRH